MVPLLNRSRCGLLHRLERDDGKLQFKVRLQLVVACDGEIALRLDDQKARRHADLEPALFRVEPLLGELASELGGADALTILL